MISPVVGVVPKSWRGLPFLAHNGLLCGIRQLSRSCRGMSTLQHSEFGNPAAMLSLSDDPIGNSNLAPTNRR